MNSSAVLWFVGWITLVLGLAMLDVPTWYAVTGVVGGIFITLFGLAAENGDVNRKK